MEAKTYYKLEKIAVGYSTGSGTAGFAPSDLHILDALGLHETGYNPYASDSDFNKYYMRTRVRGTWGDPNIPRKDWTSSTAWTPWQITKKRSSDIAKYDDDYAKLHTATLMPVYAEMLRTGLGKHQYNVYKTTGKLPVGFSGIYNASADYGGSPRKMSAAEHNTIRKGMLTYINKHMIPRAMKIAKGDENKFWRSIASQHYLGHPWPINDNERAKLDEYWTPFSESVAKMRRFRSEYNRRKLDAVNKGIQAYTELVKGANGRSNEATLQQLINLKERLVNSTY